MERLRINETPACLRSIVFEINEEKCIDLKTKHKHRGPRCFLSAGPQFCFAGALLTCIYRDRRCSVAAACFFCSRIVDADLMLLTVAGLKVYQHCAINLAHWIIIFLRKY